MRPVARRPSLTDVLDEEAATGGTPCGAEHHTDEVTCQRPEGHLDSARHSRDLHAARRVWRDGEAETWATWT